MLARRFLRKGEIEKMKMPDYPPLCDIRCDSDSDTGPVSDDYSADSDADSGDVSW